MISPVQRTFSGATNLCGFPTDARKQAPARTQARLQFFIQEEYSTAIPA